MARNIIRGISLSLAALIIFCAVICGAYNYAIPDSIGVMSVSEVPRYPFVSADARSDSSDGESFTVDYKLFGMLPLKSVTVDSYAELKLYPGGMPFGIKFATDGVMIVGFCDVVSRAGTTNPSASAGLKINDMIKKINGKAVTSAAELTKAVEESGGKPLTVEYTRGKKSFRTTLTPAYSESECKYKTGVYVRDGGAGIGTVTFICPETFSFGGLGHGICDASSGEIVAMTRGSVVDVTISGVVKGEAGAPGEVKGYFSSGKTGTLISNTDCGVFGMFAEGPRNAVCEPLPVGLRDELKEGSAYIYCTLDTNKIEKYEVQISAIDRKASGNKCFTVKITDKALLDKTGGIIQGMSGSPIIQNGKLVGAVTHVLINDPTTGYGIFIENMLTAAQMPMQKAA